jgi:hypothetical protein
MEIKVKTTVVQVEPVIDGWIIITMRQVEEEHPHLPMGLARAAPEGPVLEEMEVPSAVLQLVLMQLLILAVVVVEVQTMLLQTVVTAPQESSLLLSVA